MWLAKFQGLSSPHGSSFPDRCPRVELAEKQRLATKHQTAPFASLSVVVVCCQFVKFSGEGEVKEKKERKWVFVRRHRQRKLVPQASRNSWPHPPTPKGEQSFFFHPFSFFPGRESKRGQKKVQFADRTHWREACDKLLLPSPYPKSTTLKTRTQAFLASCAYFRSPNLQKLIRG